MDLDNASRTRSKQDGKLKDLLDVFPDSIKEHFFTKINNAINYEPVIGVMGKTGAGKSSLCNAIFRGEACAVSDVQACTRQPQELQMRFGGRSLRLIDIPGVGESAERDKEYEKLYRELLPTLDLVLWVIKADDRTFTADEHFYHHVLKPAGGIDKTLFVLNQVDKIEPFREWNTSRNTPSAAQLENISRKKEDLVGKLGFTRFPIVSVSANDEYNITKLVETMIRALPVHAKSNTTVQLKEKLKTDEVITDAKEGWGATIAKILDEAVESLPLPPAVKALVTSAKIFVVESAKKLWNRFFG